MKKAISGNIITYTFDGDVPAIVFDLTKVSIEIKHYAMCDRLMQRCGDPAAISKSADNSYVITEQMRHDAVLPYVQHYESGTCV